MRAFSNVRTYGLRAAAALCLVLSLLALCTGARAQEPQGEQQPRQALGGRHRGRDAGASLMRRLNLTPEQRERLREIRRQNEPRARALASRVRLARRALDEAIYADALDESLVERRSRELAAAQAEMVRLRAASEVSVRRVLTAEQLRAFRELRREAQRRQLLQRRHRRGVPRQPPPTDAPLKTPQDDEAPPEAPALPGQPDSRRQGP